MAKYLGNRPTAVPLTSADIQDGVITAADLGANSVDSSELVDNSVTLAKMAGLARGKLIYGDASGDPAALAVGAADEVLTHDGTDFDWAAAGGEDNTPVFHADRGGGAQLQFNSGAYGDLDYPTEVVDTNSAFASSTFTVPSGHAGKYFIYATGEFYQNIYDCMIRIRKNGSDLDEGTYREKRQSDSSLWLIKYVWAYTTIDLSVSDALTVRVFAETSDAQYNIYPKKSVHFGGYKITA